MSRLLRLPWTFDSFTESKSSIIIDAIALFGGVFLFYLYRQNIIYAPIDNESYLFRYVCALIISFAFVWIGASRFPKSSLYMLRPVFILLGLYLLIANHMLPLTQLGESYQFELNIGRMMAVMLFFCAWWRPSLSLYSFSYLYWYKKHVSAYYGVSISYTDYMALIDVGSFLVVALLFLNIVNVLFKTTTDSPNNRLKRGDFLVVGAISVHFANYLYSGIEKIRLGENFFDWVLYNKTHFLMSSADALGNLPLSFSSNLSFWVYRFLEIGVIPFNALILITQLVAILAVNRISWMIGLTLFYDITHIGIYLVSGIFFYKWIVLNAAIVGCLLVIRYFRIGWDQRILLMALMLVSPYFYSVAKLGWFDTRSVNLKYVEAVDDQGNGYRVPSNYFMPISVTAAQSRFVRSKEGYYPSATYGATFSVPMMNSLKGCDYEVDMTKDFTQNDKSYRAFERLTKLYHPQIINHLDESIFNYNVYPHHVFSNSWGFEAFEMLDKQKIVAYRHVTEAICFEEATKPFDYTVKRRGVYEVKLEQ